MLSHKIYIVYAITNPCMSLKFCFVLSGIWQSKHMHAVPALHSRAMQEKFAAERNWEQYHTPRNLLLAMVNLISDNLHY